MHVKQRVRTPSSPNPTKHNSRIYTKPLYLAVHEAGHHLLGHLIEQVQRVRLRPRRLFWWRGGLHGACGVRICASGGWMGGYIHVAIVCGYTCLCISLGISPTPPTTQQRGDKAPSSHKKGGGNTGVVDSLCPEFDNCLGHWQNSPVPHRRPGPPHPHLSPCGERGLEGGPKATGANGRGRPGRNTFGGGWMGGLVFLMG